LDQAGEAVTLPLRERALVLGALGAIALLAWLYLLHHATAMPPGGTMVMPSGDVMVMKMEHDSGDFVLLALMWVVMMLGMMLPSVASTVLVHAAVSRRVAPARAGARNAAFVGGYAIAWSAFALGAAGAQVALGQMALLSEEMRSSSPMFAAALLVAAGIWQLTPMKDLCLSKCRMPLQFVAEHWREGVAGALRMGISHGLYCIGCCGALMALLFVGGVMNLVWVGLIAAFVLIEKTTFQGTRSGRWISGAGLLVSAAFIALL
jgi:predicted metal-binding membrane protein